MPKHALTFKHLLGTVSTQRATPSGSNSNVNDLLERSRASRASSAPPGSKEPPPHLVAWTPSAGSGPESVGVHPAELVRREAVAHASAARRVAGPAPPRSWRPREAVKAPEEGVCVAETEASEDALAAAEAFLGQTPRRATGGRGPPGLVDICLQLTLELLRDDAVVWDGDEHEGAEGEGGDGDGEGYDGPVTMAEAVRAGVAQLDLHLRGALLSASARLPQRSPLRLSDTDIRVLLEDEALAAPAVLEGDPESGLSTGEKEGGEEDDWDTDTAATRPTLQHLPLAAHPAPLRLLRDIPRFAGLTLTSLNLAFAVVPPLERVVAALPAGLRALGIAGVRGPKSSKGEWERGLGALARKMIVLQTLDVSYLPLGSWGTVAALFPTRAGTSPSNPLHLPSLRVLGLRGDELGGLGDADGERDDGDEDTAARAARTARRKVVRAAVIDGAGHWVDVRFE